ncbi:MAG: rRNA maturation RNase YbeY [Acidobacteriota bacterium]|nr:rRNA maturation RNase YbeY [Acidobacteriota bacterium]
MPEVINNQRKIKIKIEGFQMFVERAIENIPEAKEKSATIAFVSDRKMRELNKNFRGKNSTTDVLSFPFEADEFETDEDILGDIIISVEQAEKQARENDLDIDTEIKQLILHGVLHLCGYDHEIDNGEMNELELKLRDKLQINF